MGTETTGPEALTIEALAAQMFGLSEQIDQSGNATNDPPPAVEEQPQGQPNGTHPAWQNILDTIPQQYHDKVIPTLRDWDAGVSRRFQKIHDEFEPLKAFSEYDPAEVQQAIEIARALDSNPQGTWEAIGRAYGLSPQQVSQAMSASGINDDEDEEFDINSLPKAVRDSLLRVNDHEKFLEQLAMDMSQRQASDEEAAEEQALVEVLEELTQTYGEFDEDYVVGLMAAGVDPDIAVQRFKALTNNLRYGDVPNPPVVNQQQSSIPNSGGQTDALTSAVQQSVNRPQAPMVLPGGGGVPNTGGLKVEKLSDSQTTDLIAEILRQSNKG